MCFYSSQNQEAEKLKKRFNAEFPQSENFHPKAVFNGFEHPQMAILKNDDLSKIVLAKWGLIPYWAKDTSIQKSTLNARIETLFEKAAFKHHTSQRCIVPLDGFYEWKWLDEKGKAKQKYLIKDAENEIFSVAGLWNNWVNASTGEVIPTFTLITTQANELMSEIHNTKKRMPLILSPQLEQIWLEEGKILDNSVNLKAWLI